MRRNRALAANIESASDSHQQTLAVQYQLAVAHQLREASWQQRLDEISARSTSALRGRAVADAAPPALTPIPDLNAPAMLSGLPDLTVSADLVDSVRAKGGRLEPEINATSALLGSAAELVAASIGETPNAI
jgi:hypothetical protein